MPIHQCLKTKSYSLTNFAVNRNQKYPPSCPRKKSCRPLHAISAALHNTLCTPVSLPFRDPHSFMKIVFAAKKCNQSFGRVLFLCERLFSWYETRVWCLSFNATCGHLSFLCGPVETISFKANVESISLYRALPLQVLTNTRWPQ